MTTIHAGEPALIEPGADATGDDLYKAGLAYSTGQGAPLSYIDAHKWFNLAALAGVVEAKTHRRELSELMSPNEIAEAQQAARDWVKGVATGEIAPAKTAAAADIEEDVHEAA